MTEKATKKPAEKPAEKTPADPTGPYRKRVRAFVAVKNKFGVTAGPFVRVHTDLELNRTGRVTYYPCDAMSVMPLAHALDLVQAGKVAKGSIVKLPEASPEKFTGIVRRVDEPPPLPPRSEGAQFEDAVDIDGLKTEDSWSEDD